jgi:hypothetical protein
MSGETFLQFCTRPSGFGRTPWWGFVTIQAFVIMLAFAGLWTWPESGWVAIAFAVAIEAVLFYGTWMNWKGKQV